VGTKKYGKRVSEKKNLTYTDYLLSTNDPAWAAKKIFRNWRKNRHKTISVTDATHFGEQLRLQSELFDRRPKVARYHEQLVQQCDRKSSPLKNLKNNLKSQKQKSTKHDLTESDITPGQTQADTGIEPGLPPASDQ